MYSQWKKKRSIVIDSAILNSKAYWALKVHGIRVLTTFYMKRKVLPRKDSKGNVFWEVTNNGELVFTYKEAETKWEMSRKQFRDALDDLIAKGFLEVTHQGTGPGEPSTYRLTERWQTYGTKNNNPAAPRRRNEAKNMGWNIYNERNTNKD